MIGGRSFFLLGVLLTTLSTLALEIVDTRLLSVATWYHLSFFAVSMAMFGMAAGAVYVYLGEEEFSTAAAPAALARYCGFFAVSIPLSNLFILCIPIPDTGDTSMVVATLATAALLAVPFFLSGIVVAISLTRIPGPSGLVYAIDLLGAALGCVVVLAVFDLSSITSSTLVIGAVAAVAAACFSRFAADRIRRGYVLLAISMLGMAGANEAAGGPVGVMWMKGEILESAKVAHRRWTIHGQIVADKSLSGRPMYWGPGRGSRHYRVEHSRMRIDGAAGTWMTRWSGEQKDLEWVRHDVTALPYHLRRGGNNAVIGVGGGRDILTALWGQSRAVTGIEINEAFIDLLQRSRRDYARIADDPRVELVHDEARSYLTRRESRFDVIQMSLIDTWAATGAGAFTLSENGLYTVEAWNTFLGALEPGGVFSVSRWFSPDRVSETSRLLSLATATLLERGIERPEQHMVMASIPLVATLLVSNQPFTAADLQKIKTASEFYGDRFQLIVSPGQTPSEPLIQRIVSSRSLAELQRATADAEYDFSPPTDERPYFFNILRPIPVFQELLRTGQLGFEMQQWGVVASGNLLATFTLAVLWLLTVAMVTTVIIGPLATSGLPSMSWSSFSLSCLYFALVGAGFMLVQIPLMQRFSVYLGHPTYAVAVILFSMILATGVGSYLSDQIGIEDSPRWPVAIPLAIAANLLIWTTAIQLIIDQTIQYGLAARILWVVAVVGVVALPLGCCFPIGLRIVRRVSEDAMPWMFGVNGATGVLASVSAVAISMWAGISFSLYLGAVAYGLLAVPALLLWRRGNP